jgi:hypothetical protein
MKVAKVFVSHTDSDETQRRATTAIIVELRRLGLNVWVDRENPPPTTSSEQAAAGPTSDNPLFHHILDALISCDALLYVVSGESFEREYVRLELDPRVLYQKFAQTHPDIALDDLPFFVALVSPLEQCPSLWTYMIDGPFAGRVLNLSGAGATPLILPTVLMTMVREIAPDHMLPLDPVTEWAIRMGLEDKAVEAPGCPPGVPASRWRRFENLFGLGPLFPNSLSSLTEEELRYAIYRIGDTMRLCPPKPNAPERSLEGMDWRRTELVSPFLALWTANALLRSKTLRLHTGSDIAVDQNLPNVVRAFSSERNQDGKMCAVLQYCYALLTSPTRSISQETSKLLDQCRQHFVSAGATPLSALADLLLNRATGRPIPGEAATVIAGLNCNPEEGDLRRLYHAVLDAAFPGPRLEATEAYRLAASAFFATKHQTAVSMTNTQFGRAGAEQFPEDYWERAIQCPACHEWIKAELDRCSECGARFRPK